MNKSSLVLSIIPFRTVKSK